MRTVLVGAVGSSERALRTMVALGYPPLAMVHLPPAKAGRHSDYVDVGHVAQEHGVEAIGSANVNSESTLAAIRELDPEFIFVIGWSQLCREEFLNLAPGRIIGYHPALLPKNRGRGVLPWTILQGDTQTGATLFWMGSGMDDGDILVQQGLEIAADETVTTLYDKQLDVLEGMLEAALPSLANGTANREPQAHSEATYCARRVPADGYIDWDSPADQIWTLIRAVTHPYPGAFTFYGEHRLRVWGADLRGASRYWGMPGQIVATTDQSILVSCGDGGVLELTEFDFVNGPVRPDDFKLHGRLGVSLLDLHEAALRGTPT